MQHYWYAAMLRIIKTWWYCRHVQYKIQDRITALGYMKQNVPFQLGVTDDELVAACKCRSCYLHEEGGIWCSSYLALASAFARQNLWIQTHHLLAVYHQNHRNHKAPEQSLFSIMLWNQDFFAWCCPFALIKREVFQRTKHDIKHLPLLSELALYTRIDEV